MEKLYEDIPDIIIDKNDISKVIKISLTIEEKLYNEFRYYCDDMGFKYSSRISKLIIQDLNKNDKLR